MISWTCAEGALNANFVCVRRIKRHGWGFAPPSPPHARRVAGGMGSSSFPSLQPRSVPPCPGRQGYALRAGFAALDCPGMAPGARSMPVLQGLGDEAFHAPTGARPQALMQDSLEPMAAGQGVGAGARSATRPLDGLTWRQPYGAGGMAALLASLLPPGEGGVMGQRPMPS